MKYPFQRASRDLARCFNLFIISGYVFVGLGCAGNPTTKTGSNPGGPYTYLTGNWELIATPAAGSPAFAPVLSGFINEEDNEPGTYDFTTAALQIESKGCYTGPPQISLQGAVLGQGVGLTSFAVDNQVLTIGGAKDASGTHFIGNYSVSGGCADGTQGSIYATLYAPLQGAYTNTVSSAPEMKVSLNLAQDAQGTGDGRSFVSGSAAFQGFSCFSTGTLPAQNGYVIGSAAKLTFVTDEAAGSQVTLIGTFDPTADQLTISSIVVTGGACAGSFAGTDLTRPS